MKTDLLIAEADPTLREVYERQFSESGLRVETATDGLDCWTKLRASPPDALLVDMAILWGGSEGVLDRLREDSDGIVDPEIFVTGDDSPENLSRRTGIAVARCFQKPIEFHAILNSLSDVFATDSEFTQS